MTRDLLVSKIHKCTSLPSLPTIAVKVLEMARLDEVEIHDMAELISNDPALSSKVLKTVNSPFYGLTKTVSTISNALVILGTEAVKTLVLGFSLVSSIKGEDLRCKTQMCYWRRSLYSAVAGRLLCQRLNIIEREEVFLAALLQDIGVQVFKQVVGDDYDRMLAATPVWSGKLLRQERRMMQMCHPEAGRMLAEMWNLPPMLASVIRWHHRADSAEEQWQRSCRLVRLAGLCAEVFMGHRDPKYVARVRRYAAKGFNISQEACDRLLAEVSSSTQELAELFEINIGEQKSYEEILAEANETLQHLTLQSQIKVRQMTVQAETDPLTGVANRRKLEQKLEEEFERAGKFLRPLSVVFLDADHFKRINDTYGHAVGDQALQHLAGQLQSLARPVDTVGRYGGEEFVLLMAETPLCEAVKAAERVRQQVEATPLQCDGHTIPMTVSLGVAGFAGAGGPYRVAGHLMQAADRAAYAAKAAGRNTVRVFAPKPKAATAG